MAQATRLTAAKVAISLMGALMDAKGISLQICIQALETIFRKRGVEITAIAGVGVI